MSDQYRIDSGTGSRIQDMSSGQGIAEDIKEKGLSEVEQGQLVTGTVISVGEQVTLDFDGQEVTTQNSALKDVQPGDKKTFEVVKATPKIIELRLREGDTGPGKTIVAVRIAKADWDTLMDQKEQSSRKSEQDTQYQKIKSELARIASTLTEEDCTILEKEGFPIESFTPEGLEEALGRIKSGELNKEEDKTDSKVACNDKPAAIADAGKATQKKTNQALTPADRGGLTERLQKEQLPATQDNLSRLSQALKLSDSVSKLDDRTMKILIAGDYKPTTANIYKAYYSKSSHSGGDYNKLTDKAWKELEKQVNEVITKAGYEVTEQNLSDAKWLIENKIPLTTQTFTYRKELESVKENSSYEEILNKMLTGMKNGTSPEEVSLVSENLSQSEKLIADINSISDVTITKAVQSNCKLTISNLVAIQESSNSQTESDRTKAQEDRMTRSDSQTVNTAKQGNESDKVKGYGTLITDSAKYQDKAADYITKEAAQIELSVEKIIKNAKELFDSASESQDKSSTDIKEVSDKISKLTMDIKGKASDIADAAKKVTVPAVANDNGSTFAKPEGRSLDSEIAHTAADIIKTATEVTKFSVDISHGASDLAQAITGSVNQETDNSDKAINITRAAVDITREISDITKVAMKLIDVTQDIEKPVTNLVQTAADTQVQEEVKSHDSESESESKDQPSGEPKDSEYEELKAQRQLQEIRLKMTLEAAQRLEKKGISVDTEELGRVVEELREQENEYYKKLLAEADTQITDSSVQALKDTTQNIERLKQIPCSVLGSTLALRTSQTIEGLVTEGSRLQAEYVKAGTAYETLATVPNAEYGDSLKKAFANADSLLNQLGLENTQANQRAIRILGYNQMEVTQEAIDQVKAYDAQVTDLIHNLHPAVAVRMVKEGMNPLNMPINDLNRMIDQMKQEQGITSEDKYSTYLRNLEKQEGISAEERKAYIGIYRLLYNVEKSDGAVVGAVVKADREVTLGNLLTAIQTNKKGSLNAVIDEEFGTLQSITHNGETITSQLKTLTAPSQQGGAEHDGRDNSEAKGQSMQESGEQLNTPLQTDAGDTQDADVKEKTQYLDRILKRIKEELTPEKLADSSISLDAASQRQQVSGSDKMGTSSGIWEKIKEVPVEKLLEKLQKAEQVPAADQEEYKAKVQELRELSKTAEQSIRFLNDYRMPATPLNIMMANNLLINGETPMKKLLKLKNENRVENSEKDLKETKDLSDTLVDKNSMQEAYETLEADAKQILEKACSQERIDSRRLAELKSMSRQMTFMKKLAEREFYQIPIETDKGVTNMNLTILHGAGDNGKVSVKVWSEQLGNVKAEFLLKGQTLKGYIGSDDRGGLKQLQNNTEILEAAAKDCNITLKKIDFAYQQGNTENYSYQNSDSEGASNKADTERILYRIAKAVVQTVRMSESSGNEQDRAVS